MNIAPIRIGFSRRKGRGAVSSALTVLLITLLLVLVLAGCGAGGGPGAGNAPGDGPADPPAEADGSQVDGAAAPGLLGRAAIVDPDNHHWPRTVRDAFGAEVAIATKPQRVVTLSLGIDEIVMALTGPERFVAISDIARAGYSNIASAAKEVPLTAVADLEAVLGLEPDILLLDGFAQPDLVAQARAADLPVVVTDLHGTMEDHLSNIRFIAYVLGEDEAGAALAAMIQGRADALAALVADAAAGHRAPRVVHLLPDMYVPGADTTSSDIIERAGGINGPAEIGLTGWQQISLEMLVAMAPEVIIHDEFDASRLRTEVLEHAAMAEVPAVQTGQIYTIPGRYLSTLSFWNLRGAEELARHLWPDAIGSGHFADFD